MKGSPEAHGDRQKVRTVKFLILCASVGSFEV